jgi:transposase-like protein
VHGAEHPSQWAAINSIAAKLGCSSETLWRWLRQAERDAEHRPALATDECQRGQRAATREQRAAVIGPRYSADGESLRLSGPTMASSAAVREATGPPSQRDSGLISSSTGLLPLRALGRCS